MFSRAVVRFETVSPIILVLIFCVASTVMGIDSSDLLFHLSFEDGVNAEFARGASKPLNEPQDLQRRLVEGVIGKGYKFAGKGCTLEYLIAANQSRTCEETYGPQVNLFSNTGTISYWLKTLSNMHDQSRDYVRFGSNGAYRDMYWWGWYFAYAGEIMQMYNAFAEVPKDEWMFWTVSWRKGEIRSYLNGILWGKMSGTGVVNDAPERFTVASQGKISVPRQKQDFEDDSIIDELQIFDHMLTDEDVRALYERVCVTGKRSNGMIDAAVIVEDLPERVYAGHQLAAAYSTSHIKTDGDLSDWKGIPAHGGFIEKHIGVLDDDPALIRIAYDDANLYLSFLCPVDESIQKDPTHVMYPAGEFKASPRSRDGNVLEDDYVGFVLLDSLKNEYFFAINAKGSLLDSKNKDITWNAELKWAGRSDFTDWTAELAIPLSLLGIKAGETVGFNVIRSWKWFKSSQNALSVDKSCQPVPCKLVLGKSSVASVSNLSFSRGNLKIAGSIIGEPGEYLIKIHGKGLGIEFNEQKNVQVINKDETSFEIEKNLEKTGDQAVVIEVFDPEGSKILSRTLPFVYLAPSKVELVDFPGWGCLKVKIEPVKKDNISAVVSMMNAGKIFVNADINEFKNPAESVMLDTKAIEPNNYEVVTKLCRDGIVVSEDRQPYIKKPLPQWYNSKAGIIDHQPVPWTPVTVEGSTVKCLLKEISLEDTLFAKQIVSNEQELLKTPIRLRIQRDGKESVISAGKMEITNKTSRRVDWTSTAKLGDLQIRVDGWIEFDGFTWMDITFSGGSVDHLSLEIPLRKESATLQNFSGRGLVPNEPILTMGNGWIGNEKAGFQYWWEDRRGWVLNGESITLTPSSDMVVISLPLFQKTVSLAKSRTVTLGWAITPSKPLRNDWRNIKLHKGITYTLSSYTLQRPNYPEPMPGETAESLQASLDAYGKQQNADIILWYAFGSFMWVGSPEYAEWYHEWQVTSWQPVLPNLNSKDWGCVCPKSSGSDLFLDKLEKFVKEYPQRGIYIDCYFLTPCDNEAHGCGYVDDNGVRQKTVSLLATRRHFERMHNIIKAADPVYGWIRIHDLVPTMPVTAFADENWSGEGLITPIGNTPEKNYYGVVDIPYARFEFRSEQWGHFQNWLTELGVYAGTDPEKRELWFGKKVPSSVDGKQSKWIVPRMKDYEHVAGLALIHDMWQIGGNDLGVSHSILDKMMKQMGWDDTIQFHGYWELDDLLKMEGAVPEKVVCSLYFKPAGTDATGKPTQPWLMLVPMNNTDKDTTITLQLNLEKFGLASLATGQLRDTYRATGIIIENNTGKVIDKLFQIEPNAPEQPYIVVEAVDEVFPMNNGSAEIILPKRSFKALMLEPRSTSDHKK